MTLGIIIDWLTTDIGGGLCVELPAYVHFGVADPIALELLRAESARDAWLSQSGWRPATLTSGLRTSGAGSANWDQGNGAPGLERAQAR